MVGSVFRHSVDKHAATIRDAVPLVQHTLDADDREAADNWLKMIGQLATTILEKPLSTPLSSEEEARPIPVNAFLRERVARLWDSEPYRLVPVTLRLQLGDGASVRASDEWLRRALEIVLHNAVKMVAGCPDPQITVRSRRAGERAEILITDTGPGIPAPVRDILFKEPIKKAEGEPGLGIGLLLARIIVEVYKGTIHIGQPGPGGTTIVISLPLT